MNPSLNHPGGDRLLTAKESAAYFRVSVKTLYRWLAENPAFPRQIHLNGKGGAVRWSLFELERYVVGCASGDATESGCANDN